MPSKAQGRLFTNQTDMIKRKKPIRRVSSKLAVQLEQYFKARLEFLAANPICKVWMDENPSRLSFHEYGGAPRSTDIHHRRGRVGKMLLDTRYWMAVSRTAHQRIHQFPKWAREKGYLLDK